MSEQARTAVINAIRLHEALAQASDGSPAAHGRCALHAAIARTMRAHVGLLS